MGVEHNLVKEAREAARFCSNFSKRRVLQRCTDELHDIFGRFTVSCSRADMQDLVAAWTRVVLVLNDLPVSPAAPTGGRMSGADRGKINGVRVVWHVE